MGHLIMSEKERQLKALLEMVKHGKLSLSTTSTQLNMSYRQIKRIYKRYKQEGDAGLIHKARGRISNRKNPYREVIIRRYKARYEDFGPTLAAEKLLEEGYTVDHETLRRWLLTEGIWHNKRQRKPYRQRRERKFQFGEMVQIDGSIHDWFENDEFECLLNMVDDATGKTLSRMEPGETTEGVFRLIWRWIELYGIPLSFYVDLKSVYVSSKKEKGLCHVENACKNLGIKIIKAYSAQAKGRVERNHAVYQDRFVKELRLKDIRTIEGANALLENGFIDLLNKKFEKMPRNPTSAHRSADGLDLNQFLCWIYERQLQHDWTFSFENKHYQVQKNCGELVHPKVQLSIHRGLDGSISAWYQDKILSIKALAKKPKKESRKENALSSHTCGKLGKQHSPWRFFNPDWMKESPITHV